METPGRSPGVTFLLQLHLRDPMAMATGNMMHSFSVGSRLNCRLPEIEPHATRKKSWTSRMIPNPKYLEGHHYKKNPPQLPELDLENESRSPFGLPQRLDKATKGKNQQVRCGRFALGLELHRQKQSGLGAPATDWPNEGIQMKNSNNMHKTYSLPGQIAQESPNGLGNK